jgi:glycine hydroxymethyltransferase
MNPVAKTLAEFDPNITKYLEQELHRQEHHLELIASENYASPRVLAAQGSILTNKYAEGYPGKRYYGGCQYVDEIEQLAIERAKALFSADYANVQPHSGSQANAAVMLALLEPQDLILGMSLADGGHLTHGSKVSFSGKIYRSETYGLQAETGLIDYDEVRDKARKFKPKMIIAGFSAYSQILDWKIFREICDEIGAYLLADIAHVAGLVAADLYPSPIPYADVVTTTTHKTLRGPRGGMILTRDESNIQNKIQSALFPGMQGGPLLHIIAAKAVAFQEALEPSFKSYQQRVIHNADVLAETLKQREISIISNGTKNHMMLLDLRKQGLTGKQADALLGENHMTVNKNSIPNDPQSPFVTSGIRIGTPAITTRGMHTLEMQTIGNWIADVLEAPDQQNLHHEIKENVIRLCQGFPVYSNIDHWLN